jgi:hypothetical protein
LDDAEGGHAVAAMSTNEFGVESAVDFEAFERVLALNYFREIFVKRAWSEFVQALGKVPEA